MESSATSIARTLRKWQDAAQAVPRITLSAVRHGFLPAGLSAAHTARKEGIAELHWKVLGDALFRFLQHSGPLFTKFGQILATRNDLLPQAVCARLEALYSKQPPMAPRQLKRALRRTYGKRLPFKKFSKTPIAVGSIGQVHRARLADDQAVIVKIIRPGVENQIERDLNVARVLLGLLLGIPRRNRKASRFYLTRSLEDLARGYAREVDLSHEGRSLQDFKRRFGKNPHVAVPEYHADLSSTHVLVMEEFSGQPLSLYRKRAKADPDAAKTVADLALTEILKQIFEDGRFHADPHAGNLLVLEDGRLGLIDLGLTGELRRKERRNIARAVKAFLARDADGLIRALLDFGIPPPDFDHQRFNEDIMSVVRKNQGKLARRLRGEEAGRSARHVSNSLEEFVTSLFGVAHDHKIYIPPSATLLIKTLVTIEGVARSLDPEINVATSAFPVILRSLTPKWIRWAFHWNT